jgi:fermentation-respiration switch protein FrsA (DUF1100 family)
VSEVRNRRPGGVVTTVGAQSRHRRRLLHASVVTLGLCATIVIGMTVLEQHLIFFPSRYPEGLWDTAALVGDTGATIESCFFSAEDGVSLNAWWYRPPASAAGEPTASMVLLWFHGNAGNLSQRADMLLRLGSLPVQVFIVDYRGYGRSVGRPSEQGLYRDASAAWRYLTTARGVPPAKLVVLGKSLGGAVAVDLAARVTPAGLIVQSSFTSVPDMAAHHFPWVPRFLVRTRMDSLTKIARVRCPILCIHSPSDEIVPHALGRKLFEAAPQPKRFYEVPGASHNDTYLVGGEAYLATLRRFVADCAAAAPR